MLDSKCLTELKEYMDFHYSSLINTSRFSTKIGKLIPLNNIEYSELETFINSKQKPVFNQTLLRLIDKKGVPDTQIYKKAGIDRRLFSKIRSNSDYHPSKNTVVAFAIALELNKNDTDFLLKSAGYSLSNSVIFDLVIQFFVEKERYDMHDIDEALSLFSIKPLIETDD